MKTKWIHTFSLIFAAAATILFLLQIDYDNLSWTQNKMSYLGIIAMLFFLVTSGIPRTRK